MRNKSIQNINIQTNTKVQRKDDRQRDTCSENFTQIYSWWPVNMLSSTEDKSILLH